MAVMKPWQLVLLQRTSEIVSVVIPGNALRLVRTEGTVVYTAQRTEPEQTPAGRTPPGPEPTCAQHF